MILDIRPIGAAALACHASGLAGLLIEATHDGASLGFLAPLSHRDARAYWLSLEHELRTGARLLLGAFRDDELVGAAQLYLPSFPNARHRAEIHKVIVAGALRGQRVGTLLMMALHDAARTRERRLILLRARRGDPAETFYRRAGYHAAGVTPGYSLGPDGRRYDDVAFYQELAP